MGKPINSRAKGASFERKVARLLLAWLGDDWEVTRNQTDRQKGQAGCAGEFTIRGPFTFPFAIECKAHETFTAFHLFTSPVPGPLASTAKQVGFWDQACSQADAVGLEPLLIVKRNNRPTLAIMHRHDWAQLTDHETAMCRFVIGPHRLVAVTLDALLTTNHGQLADIART